MENTPVGVEPEYVSSTQAGERNWYVIRVKPQHERTVSYALARKDFDCYVPLYTAKRRWADSLKELDLPLFPGYVFCRMNHAHAAEILRMPAVYQLVGEGNWPAFIEEPELHRIQRIEKAGLPISPWPYLKKGQQVRVASGPLAGLDGVLATTPSTWHVVVNVQLLQRGVAVAVNQRDLITLASAASA